MTYPQSDLTGLAVDEVGMRLLKAADIMQRRGHAKRLLCDDDGRVCVRGAIFTAIVGNPTFERATQSHAELSWACERRLSDYLGQVSVVDWNNEHHRTADEVIDALTAAALSHAAQG